MNCFIKKLTDITKSQKDLSYESGLIRVAGRVIRRFPANYDFLDKALIYLKRYSL